MFTAMLMAAPVMIAQTTLGPVTVGAGIQGGFTSTSTDGSGSQLNKLTLDSARIYINGSVTENIKLMFNTEYDGATNKVGILDAAAQFSLGKYGNVWAGRFLPPSDRSNLYGPYYSHEYKVYTDGIQDGYPFVATGRDNGVLWWSDFGKHVKVSAGMFDGASATGNNKLLGAARVQIDFWDKEEGYYLNGTYFGDKNLLAIGGATQFQDGKTAASIDFLLEKKLKNEGVISVESEYTNYNGLGGYDSRYANSQGAYGLVAYMFPKVVPIANQNGKFEILGKFAKAEFTQGKIPNYSQKTTEFNFNYVIKQHKARVMTFIKDTRFSSQRPNTWQAGIGLQLQI